MTAVVDKAMPRRLTPPVPMSVSESNSSSDRIVMVMVAAANSIGLTNVGVVTVDVTDEEKVESRIAKMDPFDTRLVPAPRNE